MAETKTKIILTAEDRTRAAVQSAKSGLNTLSTAAASLKVGFAALGGLAALSTLAAFAKSSINAADNLSKLSQRVGVSVETLSELEYAGKLADVSLDQMSGGLRILSKNMQDTARGSGEAVEAFRALGISVTDGSGKLKASDVVMREIADKFSGIEDGAGKTALAMRIFGDAGAAMIPLLNGGSTALNAAAEEARQLGLVIDKETAQAAERFNDDLTKLSQTAAGLGRTLVKDTIGPLSEITKAMALAAKESGILMAILVGLGGVAKEFFTFKEAADTIESLDKEIERQAKVVENFTQRLKSAQNVKGTIFESSLQNAYEQANQRYNDLLERRVQLVNELNKPAGQAEPKKKAAPTLASSSKQRDTDPIGDEIRRSLAAESAELVKLREKWLSTIDPQYQYAQNLREINRLREHYAESGGEFGLSEQEAAEAMAKLRQEAEDATPAAQRLKSILSQTDNGRIKQQQDDMLLLAQAYESGKLSVEDYFQAVDISLGRVKEKGKDTFEELESAIQGWGREFTDTLTDAVMTGEFSFRKLADSIIRDIIRIQIQKTITEPLIKAGTDFLGGIFSGGGGGGGGASFGGYFASGGPVDPGKYYVVGERGPEILLPRTAGTVLPNSAMSGMAGTTVQVVQYNTVDARSDRASIMSMMDVAKENAKREILASLQRGGVFATAAKIV